MRLDIVKAHGTANDFVVVEDLPDELTLDVAHVRALCDRRRGIGADGVIRVVADGGSGESSVFMDYRNSDGSIAEMCGNGARVFAKYCFDRGILVGTDAVIGTRAGPRGVHVQRDGAGRVARVDVDMGGPVFDPGAIGVSVPSVVPDEPVPVALDADGVGVDVLAVGMGNPHAVLFVDDVATAPVASLGPAIERHALFANGTNVSFARVAAPHRIELRVWERGSGETRSCGTAACATVVAAAATGRAQRSIEVDLPGGAVHVTWNDSVVLSGPAVEVFAASVDVAELVAAGAGR